MKEFTQDIIEVLSQMGTAKIKEAGSVEALVAMIKEHGVEAEPEEVMAAMHELVQLANDKEELDVDAMENVAGGIAPAALIPLIPTVIDGITTVVKKIKGDPKKPETTPAAPTTTNAPTTAPQGPSVTQNFTENTKFSNQVNVNGNNNVGNLDFTA